MSHWRSLLQLVFLAFICAAEGYGPHASGAQIQCYPVDVIYLKRKGGASTNDLRAGLAHYWVGGSHIDSVGGANVTDNARGDIHSINSDINQDFPQTPVVSGLDVALTCFDTIQSNKLGICPQNSLTSYLQDTNPLPVPSTYDMTGGKGVSFSFQCWVHPFLSGTIGAGGGYGGCQTLVEIVSKWNEENPTNQDWHFVRGNLGSAATGLSFIVMDATNGIAKQVALVPAGAAGTPTNWMHIVCTYDDTKTNLSGYLNGVLVSSVAVAGVTNSGLAPGSFNGVEFMNHYRNTPTGAGGTQRDLFEFVGDLAEISWWTNYALSQNDVTRLYNNGAGFPLSQLGKSWGRPVYNNVGAVQLLYTGPGNLFVTFDGSNPNPGTLIGNVSAITSATPPAGTYFYDGIFAAPWNCTLTALSTNKPYRMLVTNIVDFGQNWSNQVVLNGGANPSAANANAIKAMGKALNNAGAMKSMLTLNVFAPDSLIAAQTPCVWFAGTNEYINHNFVGGDLGANGITGNGSTKFMDSAVNLNPFGPNLSMGVYAYTASATGFSAGQIDTGTTKRFALAAKFSDNNAYYESGAGANNIQITPSPGNGFYLGSRESATVHKGYFASSVSAWAQQGSTDTTSYSTAYSSNLTPYIWAAFQEGSGGASSFSSDTISTFFIAGGLTTTQGQNSYNAIQACRTTFGGGFR